MGNYKTGPLNKEDGQFIKEAFSKGMSVEDIARRINRRVTLIEKKVQKQDKSQKEEESKTGRFGKDKNQKIRDLVAQGMSTQEIAKEVNRTVQAINNFITRDSRVGLTGEEIASLERVQQSLYTNAFWRDVKEQLTDNEARYFEDIWCEMLLKQFREDLLPAEQLQLKNVIILNILMDRSMKDRRECIEDREKAKRQLNTEIRKGNDGDSDLIMSLEQQIEMLKSNLPTYTADHTKLFQQLQNAEKNLKTTRDQRLKKIDDAKTSWTGFIRSLEDEEQRRKVGTNAEMFRVAADRATEKLGEYHTYVDGQVDKPLFNAETVE